MTDSSFLDENQYTLAGISDYQAVFGQDFVSPGGIETARHFLKELDLPAGSLILDLCCGLGGASFLMAREFDWKAEGLDLSQNMLGRARIRCAELNLENQVSFTHGDCLKMERPGRYDAIYSRDSFLHIAPKNELCRVLFESLKPGGQLLFTDYCCSRPPWSSAFQEYVSQHHYHLATLDEYASELQQAGFELKEATDLSAQFLAALEAELEKIRGLSSMPNQSELLEGWQGKIARCKRGEQLWGKFRAIRPET